MTTLYDLTVPFLINALKAEQHLLAQAEAFATEKGIPIAELLESRLAEDMWPLSQQIVITAIHSKMTVLKLTGNAPVDINFGPAPLEDCKKYLTETIALLESVTPESVNGKESTSVGAMMGPGPEVPMKAVDYVEGYLKPNVLFHVTTLYDILRSKGASLGKKDYLSTFIRVLA
ncbi:hypothetical protein GQX73_g4909 [Xylaria multiplex]|uniref:DUF1993 domain-containing protein n=1 Tax=Xylaria multiplex TaxID=323545 RepID=A0A7C8IV54_9PEZI|nr:hypothetical protein GQX73_g4909 [Xylaria multiplex]